MRVTRRGAVRVALGGAAALLLGAAREVPVPVPRPALHPGAGARGLRIPTVPRHQSGVAGWMVLDLDSGEVLDAHGANAAFAPASVAKLPTAVYALDRLGPEHRFETRVAVTGAVRHETLEGDLFLVGGGDPELDSDALLPLVMQMRDRGIHRIAGQFLVDGSAGVQQLRIDGDQPVDAAYNPSISALNLNFNRVRLKWDARRGAKTLRLSSKAARLDPEVAGVRVALAPQPDAPVLSHGMEGEAEVWHFAERAFRGEGARWLPVRQPELYAGEVFQSLAATHGVRLGPARLGTVPADAEVIARHHSRPLEVMLKYMLRYSTNLTAEMAGMAASRAEGATPASLAESAAAMNAWAAGYAGFPAGDPGFQLVNHSGLATESRLSPRRMVEFLAAAARRHPEPDPTHPRLPGGACALMRSYNIAAKSVKMDYANIDIAAKTGTMDYVRGLAGYVATPSGRRLAFAIFSNDIDRRQPGPARRVNKRWLGQSRVFERKLLRTWIKTLEG